MTAQERWDRLKEELDAQLDKFQTDLRFQTDSSTAYMLAANNRIRLLKQIQAFMRGLENEKKAD